MGGRLLDATADPARQSPALELLRKFGSEAAPQLASAWADPARPEAQRAVLEPLLVSLGEAAVAPLLRLIGPESAPGDEAVARVLLALGDDAIPALAAGVADPSAGRPHRTEWILRLLHRAGAAGHAALERLADSDLAGEHRLLVARLLHARRDANHDGGDHGQVG